MRLLFNFADLCVDMQASSERQVTVSLVKMHVQLWFVRNGRERSCVASLVIRPLAVAMLRILSLFVGIANVYRRQCTDYQVTRLSTIKYHTWALFLFIFYHYKVQILLLLRLRHLTITETSKSLIFGLGLDSQGNCISSHIVRFWVLNFRASLRHYHPGCRPDSQTLCYHY